MRWIAWAALQVVVFVYVFGLLIDDPKTRSGAGFIAMCVAFLATALVSAVIDLSRRFLAWCRKPFDRQIMRIGQRPRDVDAALSKGPGFRQMPQHPRRARIGQDLR